MYSFNYLISMVQIYFSPTINRCYILEHFWYIEKYYTGHIPTRVLRQIKYILEYFCYIEKYYTEYRPTRVLRQINVLLSEVKLIIFKSLLKIQLRHMSITTGPMIVVCI